MTLRTLILTTLALSWGLPAFAADTAYVIDKLLVGLHQHRDLNSAIVKVLPTGTKLEVVERDGELALVKDPTGSRGWVDSAYLMEEAPAGVKVSQLNKEVADLRQKLSAAKGTAAGSGVSSEQRDKLAKENTELKRKLSAEKLKIQELQTNVGKLQSKVAAHSTTPADTIIEDLESTNLELSRDLERAIQRSHKFESELDKVQGLPRRPIVVESFSSAVLGSIGFALLLAFGGGLYFMDYLNRRRHGGFRV